MSAGGNMRVGEGLAALHDLPEGLAMSVGNFDGVHLGHQRILEIARRFRDEGQAPGGVAVVTFEPHPLAVLRPEAAPPRLSTAAQKRELLRSAGVDHLVVLPPAPEVLHLSAEAFWHLLRDRVRPRHLIEGDTFTFGRGRGGNIDVLRGWAANGDVSLHVVGPVETALLDLSVVAVNSTLIRWLLACGRVRDAAICLGRPYALEGEVIHGQHRGRTIDVPTANLRVVDQLIPLEGVYAGRCTIGGVAHMAAVSIGTAPTFDGQSLQVEAHIPGFDGDLYGQTLRVELIDWVREQCPFPGVEALKAQIARDIKTICGRPANDPARAFAQVSL